MVLVQLIMNRLDFAIASHVLIHLQQVILHHLGLRLSDFLLSDEEVLTKISLLDCVVVNNGEVFDAG